MLTKENTGIVVVDIQGKLADLVVDSDNLKVNVSNLISGAKILNLPILWLEQNPQKLGGTAPEIQDLLAPQSPITKYTFNACNEPLFTKQLAALNIKNWLICGIEAHICVYQTALGIKALGYHVELVLDAISSRTEANKALAINKLSANGIGVTSVEMCLYEMIEDCRVPEFKHILSLIK